MPWFRTDDKFPFHRKVLSIPRGQRRCAAVGAWTILGAWAADGAEGRFPASTVEEFGIPRRAVDDLLACGLWERDGDGYMMHDYLDYNPSAEQIEADKEAARKRQKRARDKARESRDSHAVTNGEDTALVTVPPSRPVPSPGSSSVDLQPSPPLPAQRHADDDPIDRLVAKLGEFYGLPYPENEALRTARFITDGKRLDDPVRYVMAAVQRDPDRYRPSTATPTPDGRKADYGPPLTDAERDAAAKAAAQAKAALAKARSLM